MPVAPKTMLLMLSFPGTGTETPCFHISLPKPLATAVAAPAERRFPAIWQGTAAQGMLASVQRPCYHQGPQNQDVHFCMKIVNRPKRTTAELIALINQRQADWWPAEFRLTIGRSAEHDWIALVDSSIGELNENRGREFANSVGQVV